jgi:hypothetical protein
MDNMMIGGPLVLRQSGVLAERARALVARTRTGLGMFGADGETDELSPPVFDLDFIERLVAVRGEHDEQYRNMTLQYRNDELNIIMNGVKRVLENVGVQYPKVTKSVNQCIKLLNRVIAVYSGDTGYADSSDEIPAGADSSQAAPADAGVIPGESVEPGESIPTKRGDQSSVARRRGVVPRSAASRRALYEASVQAAALRRAREKAARILDDSDSFTE